MCTLSNRSNKQFSRKDGSKGFTLVEALIVVTILGILGAIAIPIYQNYVSSSKNKAAQAAFEQFPLLLENYRAENGQFPVNNTYTYTEDSSGTVTTDTISAQLPEFKPRSSGATASFFRYSFQITNSGSAAESADIKVIGVNNVAGNYSGVSYNGTYN